MPYDPRSDASASTDNPQENEDPACGAAAPDANPFLQFVDPEQYRDLVNRAKGRSETGRFITPLRVVSKLRLVGTLADQANEEAERDAAPATAPVEGEQIRVPAGMARFARNFRSIVAKKAH